MKELYILDAVNFLFRSYYAIGSMTNPKGESTNAVYGLIRSVFKLIKEKKPTHLVAIFDGPDNAKSRKELYSDYKIHRSGMPDDLVYQLEWAIKFCEIAGIPFLSVPGVEADDVIGSVAKWAEGNEITSYLCSSDKDLCQLVSENIFVLNIHKDNQLLDREAVIEKFGITPEQMIDYLALMGDASDNIPGVPGIGAKTAADLLQKHGTLNYLLENPDVLKGKRKETFIESKDSAILSRELATIHTGITIPKDEDFFKLKEPDLEKVKTFYQEMRFLSLLKEMQVPPTVTGELELPFGTKEEKTHYTLVNDEKTLIELVNYLKKKNELCIDTETTSLNTMSAKLIGIGISDEREKAWYVPLNGSIAREQVIAVFKELCINPSIGFFGHNIKYDMHILKNEGIEIANISFDTMIASHLIAPQKQRHSLDILSLELFDKVKTPISDLIGKGKTQITMEEIPLEKAANYCCEDVDYTLRLKEHLAPKLEKYELSKIFSEIEIPLLRVLYEMEQVGIYLDKEQINDMHIVLAGAIEKIKKIIFKLAGEEFNLNSPKQLGEVLFEKMGIRPAKKTATGYSTSVDVLENLRETHPIIEHVLSYRTFEKLRSTYVDALPEQINPRTKRIHCTFNQSGTATGRLSCHDPNLQNIPVRSEEGRKIRTAFTPQTSGWLFLSGDYSQIELRLLAHLSDDPTLIAAFNAGEDIHTYTASLVYGAPINEVTKQMRYAAKAVNFGILYGQGAFGLSKEIGIPVNEAKAFINTYFERYSHVRDYLQSCKDHARNQGYSLTLFGRKRPIPEIDSKNSFLRSAAERLAVNTPLQGTAADLIKKAMIEIADFLKDKRRQSKMILQIHDELIFEVPPDELDQMQKIVKEKMGSIFQFKIPLVVDISIGKNWGEC